MRRCHRARRQQADAEPIGDRRLDAAEAGTGETDAPAPAQRLDRVDHVLAVQAAWREGHQRHRVQRKRGAGGAVDPAHRLGPARKRLAAAAALFDQRQVQLATVVALGQRAAQATADLQLHPWVAPAEIGQQVRGAAAGEILRHAQAQGGGHPRAGQRLAQFLVQRQQAPRVAQHGLAGIGGAHVAHATVEQPVPGQFLQPPHLLADRGLGGMQARGGGGEAAAVGHRQQGAQQIEVEQHPIRFRTVFHRYISFLDGRTGL